MYIPAIPSNTGSTIHHDPNKNALNPFTILDANPNAHVILMSDILNQSVDGSGYSPYGLLGSNRSTEDRVKLFPRTGQTVVEKVQHFDLDFTHQFRPGNVPQGNGGGQGQGHRPGGGGGRSSSIVEECINFVEED